MTSNKLILVVDDDTNLVTLIRINLELQGYDAVTASNGMEALEKIKTTNPDLIILDLRMPKLDGWGVLEEMHKQEKIVTVPVIVLSATTKKEDRKRGLELGVAEFLTKPFNVGYLMEVVHRILHPEIQISEEKKLPQSSIRVALLGKGEPCLKILHTLLGNSNVQVMGLGSREKDTAAIQLAQKLNIPVTEDPYELCRFKNLDILIETEPGMLNPAKANQLNPNLEILRGYSALFIWNLLEQREAGEVRTNSLVKELYAMSAENAKLYEDVTRSKSQIESLLSKIVYAQEEERKRVAAELHDSIAQSLVSALTKVQTCQLLFSRSEPETEKELNNLRTLLSEEIAEIRKIILNLRPAALDDLGLLLTVQNYLKKFETNEKIQTSFLADDTFPKLPEAVEITVYRIIQEALTNIKKHSEATQVTIELKQQEGTRRMAGQPGETKLYLQISDNGKGMQPKPVEEQNLESGSYGISGMKERVSILGGNIRIEAVAGKGTKLFIEIPIRRP